MSGAAIDRVEALAGAERWLADERAIAHAPGGMAQRTVDVTHLTGWIREQARSGIHAAFALLVARAVAVAVSRRTDLQVMVAGYRRLEAGAVDVGLESSELPGDTPLVLHGADRKPVRALAAVVDQALARARVAEPPVLGWWERFVPFGWLRRALLRWLSRSFWLQRRRAGTVQVTCASGADVVAPLRFRGGNAIGAGRLREVFLVVGGRMDARWVSTLTLVADHVAMDGVRAATLLNAVAEVLEGEELRAEML